MVVPGIALTFNRPIRYSSKGKKTRQASRCLGIIKIETGDIRLMVDNSSRDKRKYIRLETNTILGHKKYNLKTGDQNSFEQSMMRNVSAEGALFRTQVKFALGDFIRMEINLRGWDKFKAEFLNPDESPGSESIAVLGKVVRVEAVDSDNYDVGVCFVAYDEKTKRTMIKYIKRESVLTSP